jgi:hypothetical protein
LQTSIIWIFKQADAFCYRASAISDTRVCGPFNSADCCNTPASQGLKTTFSNADIGGRMRFFFSLAIFGGLTWFAFSPVYYFIVGPEVAKLPSHLRMSSGDTDVGCTEFAIAWKRTFPTSSAYCERVPRWMHWSNFVRNVAYQVDLYRSIK